MLKPIACFTLNSLLLPLAITVGLSSPVLAAQWVDANNGISADITRSDGPNGDGRMHISRMTSIARSLQFTLKEAPNRQTPAYRMFILICDRVQQNFRRGVIPPDLEPDWDLKPESYIEADEKIPRWP